MNAIRKAYKPSQPDKSKHDSKIARPTYILSYESTKHVSRCHIMLLHRKSQVINETYCEIKIPILVKDVLINTMICMK